MHTNEINNDDKINRKSLYNLHCKRLLNGDNNDDNTLQIVRILGGIDTILSDYLSIDNDNTNKIDRLQQNELNQLNQLFQTPTKYQQQNKLKPLVKIQDYNNNTNTKIEEGYDYFCYEFNKNHTFLHSLSDPEKATKILNALNSKVVRTIFLIGFEIYSIFYLILYHLIDLTSPYIYDVQIPIMIVYNLVDALIMAPYFILFILSVNPSGFKLLTKSFEFWLKVVYSIGFQALFTLYHYNKNTKNISDKYGHTLRNVYLYTDIQGSFCALLVVICVASLDVVHINKGWKIFLCAAIAISFIFSSVYFEFIVSEEDDYVINLPVANNTLSFQSMLSSSSRILGIFFSKQAYLSYFSSKKGRATMLKYTPFIKWTDVKSKCSTTKMDDINIVKCSATKIDENIAPTEIDLRAINTKRAKREEESISSYIDNKINEESYAL